jgi:hypothetical protein
MLEGFAGSLMGLAMPVGLGMFHDAIQRNDFSTVRMLFPPEYS